MYRDIKLIVVPVALLTFLLGFCTGIAGPSLYMCATGGVNMFCPSSD